LEFFYYALDCSVQTRVYRKLKTSKHFITNNQLFMLTLVVLYTHLNKRLQGMSYKVVFLKRFQFTVSWLLFNLWFNIQIKYPSINLSIIFLKVSLNSYVKIITRSRIRTFISLLKFYRPLVATLSTYIIRKSP